MMQLPVPWGPQFWSLASYCITNNTRDNFLVLLFIDGLAFWCILVIHYALVVEKSNQHNLHLALNLSCFFGLQGTRVTVFRNSDHCWHTAAYPLRPQHGVISVSYTHLPWRALYMGKYTGVVLWLARHGCSYCNDIGSLGVIRDWKPRLYVTVPPVCW